MWQANVEKLFKLYNDPWYWRASRNFISYASGACSVTIYSCWLINVHPNITRNNKVVGDDRGRVMVGDGAPIGSKRPPRAGPSTGRPEIDEMAKSRKNDIRTPHHHPVEETPRKENANQQKPYAQGRAHACNLHKRRSPSHTTTTTTTRAHKKTTSRIFWGQIFLHNTIKILFCR